MTEWISPLGCVIVIRRSYSHVSFSACLFRKEIYVGSDIAFLLQSIIIMNIIFVMHVDNDLQTYIRITMSQTRLRQILSWVISSLGPCLFHFIYHYLYDDRCVRLSDKFNCSLGSTESDTRGFDCIYTIEKRRGYFNFHFVICFSGWIFCEHTTSQRT